MIEKEEMHSVKNTKNYQNENCHNQQKIETKKYPSQKNLKLVNHGDVKDMATSLVDSQMELA